MRLSELCQILSEKGFEAAWEREDCEIGAVNTLESAGPGEISFVANPKYAQAVKTTKASAVICAQAVEVPSHISAIRCCDPYSAITVAIITLHGFRKHPQWGVSERVVIHETARIGPGANIAPGVSVGAHVEIGEGCTIYPGCYVADRVRIGRQCVLFPNVVIYDDCVLGDRVTIHAGSVIGQDGLGYAPHNDHWLKIPQIGRTVIGDDVEIGANCAIDRATLGQTEIGAGTKMGNVIVIGHGTRIGPDCMFVGLVGIAGSVNIGRHVTLAGQVGVAGHLAIGDNVKVGAKTGIMTDVPSDSSILGIPAMPLNEAKRILVIYRKLPDLARRVADLEQQIRALSQRFGEKEPEDQD